jgi:hypothetical protein
MLSNLVISIVKTAQNKMIMINILLTYVITIIQGFGAHKCTSFGIYSASQGYNVTLLKEKCTQFVSIVNNAEITDL